VFYKVKQRNSLRSTTLKNNEVSSSVQTRFMSSQQPLHTELTCLSAHVNDPLGFKNGKKTL